VPVIVCCGEFCNSPGTGEVIATDEFTQELVAQERLYFPTDMRLLVREGFLFERGVCKLGRFVGGNMKQISRNWLRAAMIFGPAHANSSEGKVKQLVVRASDGLQYVVIDSAISGRAACAANTTYYMITDEHSDAGKSQMAVLLSAYMSGKSVYVEGTGACTRWTDGEDILQVILR
jgi:hypothetical protein